VKPLKVYYLNSYEGLLRKHTPWIKVLKSIDIESKTAIDSKIEEKYTDDVYILKEGEIEDYLKEVKDKRLKDIIDWCHAYKDHPLQDEYKKEINTILDKIFKINRDGASKNE